tara:strand:+ start:117 stop:518 length:402 start_codon:yes stop_codon:yes gene_type:complete
MNKIVWTNGCFDILHRGHIELFKYAKSLGKILIVGLDEDSRIKSSKGAKRPVNNLQDRMEVLQSIKYIDSVVSFGTDQELKDQITKNKVQLIVVGSDYLGKKVIGSELVQETKYFRRIDGYSTTQILQNSSNW